MSSIGDDVVGQAHAIEQLTSAAEAGPVHAYLFVGPPGSTKNQAARAFAAQIISGADDPAQRDARLALAGAHPDVREVQRVGASILMDQAQEVIRLASLAPTESGRKVMILDEFHLLNGAAAAVMLKTIEEPPESTMFIICADFVPHELITISSRCARVDFRPIADGVIAARLLTEGVGPVEAQAASKAALGDLDRARLLASDSGLAERRKAFLAAPATVDGSGAVAMRLAAELLAMIEQAAEPLATRHNAEAEELTARIKESGERGSGKKQLEDRHKRELRRHRVDEIRTGLAAMSTSYRDAIVGGTAPSVDGAVGAVRKIHAALESLERNPNERLLLENLLWALPDAR